jgi:hypothetical protein
VKENLRKEAIMKKTALTLVLIVLSAGMNYAQDVNASAGISLDNGSFMYHGIKFSQICISGESTRERSWDVFNPADLNEISYFQSGSDTILVIKKKDDSVIEIPLRLVKQVVYNIKKKYLEINLL